jgi:hypothetical protein
MGLMALRAGYPQLTPQNAQQACDLLANIHDNRCSWEAKRVIPDNERTAFESIIRDFQSHYENGPEMFASRYNFDKFLDTEVRFHAKLLNIDFEKTRVALLAWIEQNHAEEYLRLI